MNDNGKIVINLPVIIALIFAYNLFFGDDDEDKKKVDPPKDNKPAISLEVSEELKETGKELLSVAKKAVKQAKEDFIDNKKQVKPDPVEEEQKEVIVVEEESKPAPVLSDTDPDNDPLKSLDDSKKDETFKSL